MITARPDGTFHSDGATPETGYSAARALYEAALERQAQRRAQRPKAPSALDTSDRTAYAACTCGWSASRETSDEVEGLALAHGIGHRVKR